MHVVHGNWKQNTFNCNQKTFGLLKEAMQKLACFNYSTLNFFSLRLCFATLRNSLSFKEHHSSFFQNPAVNDSINNELLCRFKKLTNLLLFIMEIKFCIRLPLASFVFLSLIGTPSCITICLCVGSWKRLLEKT